MKITEAMTELTPATAAGDASSNSTTVVAAGSDAASQQVLVGGYVSIVVIVAVVVLFAVGLALYKTCTISWLTVRSTGRQRHSSGHWLTSDNPAIWDDEAPYGCLLYTSDAADE